jgi:Cu/Ag efflux pump CusA
MAMICARESVTANVAGSDVAAFVRAAQAAIAAKVQLPAGSYLQFARPRISPGRIEKPTLSSA